MKDLNNAQDEAKCETVLLGLWDLHGFPSGKSTGLHGALKDDRMNELVRVEPTAKGFIEKCFAKGGYKCIISFC